MGTIFEAASHRTYPAILSSQTKLSIPKNAQPIPLHIVLPLSLFSSLKGFAFLVCVKYQQIGVTSTANILLRGIWFDCDLGRIKRNINYIVCLWMVSDSFKVAGYFTSWWSFGIRRSWQKFWIGYSSFFQSVELFPKSRF